MNRAPRPVALVGVLGAGLLGAALPGVRAAGAQVATQAAAAAPAPGALTPALTVVRVGRYAGGSLLALRADSTLLVPAVHFLRLTGIFLRPRGAQWSGAINPAAIPVELDPATRRVRVGPRRFEAAPAEFRVHDGQPYLALSVLARAFGVQTRFDADEGVLLVENAERFPVAVRAMHGTLRAAVLTAAARRATEGADSSAAVPQRQSGLGAVLDYTLSRWGGLMPVGRAGGVAGATSGSVGLAVALPRGVIHARGAAGTQAGPGGAFADVGWTWDRPNARRVRMLRTGASLSGGLRPFVLHGVMLSNASPARDRTEAVTTLAGTIPNGWFIEAWRAGTLMAADTLGSGDTPHDPTALVEIPAAAAAGTRRYRLNVPVHAGQTALDLVAVSPEGDLRIVPRLVQLMPMELPARTFEYRVGAGKCAPYDLPARVRREDCRARANIDLRYAINQRWAVRSGSDFTMLSVPGGGSRRYVAVAGTPWDAVSVSAEHSPGQLDRLAARLQPSAGMLLSVDQTVSRDVWIPRQSLEATVMDLTSTNAAALAGVATSWERSAVSQRSMQFVFAPRALHGAALQFHESQTRWGAGALGQRQLGAVFPVRAAELRPYVRREVTAATKAAWPGALASPGGTASFVGTSATVLPVGALARVLGRTWLTTVAELTANARPARAEVTLARPFRRAWRADVSTFWDRRAPGYRGALAVTAQLPSVHTSSQSSYASRGAGGLVTHTASGSAAWDPSAHALVLSGESGLERGGIAGAVFLDVDGNGRRDPGEPGIARAQVQVATRTVATDADGRYRVLGLPPETVLQLAIDSASLSSPWWVPGRRSLTVRAIAGRVVRADLPVVLGGIVNGRVTALGVPAGTPVPGGTEVVVHDLGRGTMYHADVFTDGTFSVTGLPPGRFVARVGPPPPAGLWVGDSAALVVSPARIAREDSPLNAEGPVVDDVRLTITRRATGPGPSGAAGAPDADAAADASPPDTAQASAVTLPAVTLAAAPLSPTSDSAAVIPAPPAAPGAERAACVPRAHVAPGRWSAPRLAAHTARAARSHGHRPEHVRRHPAPAQPVRPHAPSWWAHYGPPAHDTAPHRRPRPARSRAHRQAPRPALAAPTCPG